MGLFDWLAGLFGGKPDETPDDDTPAQLFPLMPESVPDTVTLEWRDSGAHCITDKRSASAALALMALNHAIGQADERHHDELCDYWQDLRSAMIADKTLDIKAIGTFTD